MSVTTRYYRGHALTVPDAYSDVDDEGGLIQPPIGVLYPLIIGDSTGGTPDKVMTFASPQAATNVLRSGPLLDAVKRAFMPFQQNSPESDLSPYLVRAIRLGDGTTLNGPHQAEMVLKDTAAGTNEVQTITFPAVLTAGTYTITFNGATTAAIAFGANAAAITAALEAIASIGTGNVVATGAATGSHIITLTFQGTLAHRDVPAVTVDTSAATPSTAAVVAEQTKGVEAGVAVITSVSKDWGAYTNSMRVTIDTPDANNTNRFGYKVTFARDVSAGLPSQYETFDNVGRYGIEITYLGSATVNNLAINGTALTTAATGVPADNLNIPFATYPTLQDVVNQINAHANYSAEVADVLGNRPANQMDQMASTDIAVPLTVSYTGSGSAAKMAIRTSAAGNILETIVTGATADNLSLPLNETVYPTLADLAVAITGDDTATVGSGTATYTGTAYTVVLKTAFQTLPVTNIQLTENSDGELDDEDYVLIRNLTPTFATAFSTTANLQAVVDHLNEFYGTLFTTTKTGSTLLPLATSPLPHFFTGGMDAVANRSGWLRALNLASTADAQIIVPITPDPYIHNAVKVHCAIMSDPENQRERVAIVGGDWGESLLDAQNRATNLGILADGDLIQVVYPGIIDVDFNGNASNIPPYLLAAQMAGMSCALGIGKAKTNKYIKAIGLEQKFNRLDLANLITSGVTALEAMENGLRKGYRVVKDISTWLASPNFIKHLFATKIAAQAVSRIVRTQCQPLIGLPNDKNFELRLKNRIETTLDNLTKMGVLVSGGQNKPAWRNIVIVRDTDTVKIDFEASIVTEVDFIFITAHLDVFRADDTTGTV